MKIQCNSCEAAEANVLCCADEAALCWACDVKVHAANKLASKHQRVPLSSSSSQMPKCDICQEAIGYFFCLEDRALLCRKCDVSIHTANSYVSGHQRFLLTGVKVGLEPTEPVGSSTKEKSDFVEKTAEKESQSVSRRGTSVSWNGENSEVLSHQLGGVGGLHASKMSFSGGTTSGSIPEWPLDDFYGITDFNQSYGYMENGSSKADSGKTGESGFSPTLQATDEDIDIDECLGKVPEISWMVPEIPSPPTASGLFWPKSFRNSPDNQVFVPDVSFSYVQNPHCGQPNISSSKRQRQF
ncbi:zinc finger protein [Macleaya cordata]|uniref:Zinc finger protein n=1 Tax=Macleaya cordata TaxID=56857 RepID=A0A200PYI7_MACCD|nr:zinc finger protein [Macleaya cordata]